LQVEAAANPTRVTFFGNGAAIFEQNGVPIGTFVYAADFPGRLDLFSQTLMRINLGLGRVLVERPRASGLRQLVAMGELHYSTTLQDANLTNVPLTNLGTAGTPAFQTITLGNADNRVDILNASLGVAAQWGPWALANGFVAPIREAPDRGFDFEYNLQLQRLF
jgi:hypothetical protein